MNRTHKERTRKTTNILCRCSRRMNVKVKGILPQIVIQQQPFVSSGKKKVLESATNARVTINFLPSQFAIRNISNAHTNCTRKCRHNQMLKRKPKSHVGGSKHKSTTYKYLQFQHAEHTKLICTYMRLDAICSFAADNNRTKMTTAMVGNVVRHCSNWMLVVVVMWRRRQSHSTRTSSTWNCTTIQFILSRTPVQVSKPKRRKQNKVNQKPPDCVAKLAKKEENSYFTTILYLLVSEHMRDGTSSSEHTS